MLKNIGLTIGGIISCFLLIALAGWFTFNYTTFGKWSATAAQKGGFLSEEETVKIFGKSRDEIFETNKIYTNYVLMPIISIIVGLLIGILGRNFVAPIISISLLPLHFFNFDNIFALLIYLVIGIGAGFLTFVLILRKEFSAFWFK